MSTVSMARDYSLTGRDSERAVARGLAAAEWYHTDLPRQQIKALMQRDDAHAIRDTIVWFAAFAVTAAGAIWLYGTWWCVPFFFAYGVLYGSSTDSRWHECGHGTAFRTRWMNQAVYQIACFMIMREPTVWRWSHARHHSDTIIVGRDPEIAVMRPAAVLRILSNFLAINSTWTAIKKMLIHAAGRLLPDEQTYIPAAEQPKVVRTARIWLAIHLFVIATAFSFQSWLPVLLVGPLPTMYGAWLHVVFGITQHAGLADNVLDHRLNSRTVYMNPLFRFLYWNMNYHIEHHMFPMVPYHQLPKLHEVMKADTPRPNSSILDAYREIIPAVLRQLREPDWYLRRELPPTARPYRPDLHDEAALPEATAR